MLEEPTRPWSIAKEAPVNHDAIRAALANLLFPYTALQLLGVVANSRRSLFVTGAPGKRKTSIARALQGVGHGRKRRSGVRRSGKSAVGRLATETYDTPFHAISSGYRRAPAASPSGPVGIISSAYALPVIA